MLSRRYDLAMRGADRVDLPPAAAPAAAALWVERGWCDSHMRCPRRFAACNAAEHGDLVDHSFSVVVHRLKFLKRGIDAAGKVIEVVAASRPAECVARSPRRAIEADLLPRNAAGRCHQRDPIVDAGRAGRRFDVRGGAIPVMRRDLARELIRPRRDASHTQRKHIPIVEPRIERMGHPLAFNGIAARRGRRKTCPLLLDVRGRRKRVEQHRAHEDAGSNSSVAFRASCPRIHSRSLPDSAMPIVERGTPCMAPLRFSSFRTRSQSRHFRRG